MKKSKQKILATILTCTFALTTVETILPNVSMIVYGAEASSETASISEILKNQLPDGGWRKNYSTTKGDWSKSTIDNGATYTEIRKLAKEYSKTKDSRYSAAVIKGINCLLDM